MTRKFADALAGVIWADIYNASIPAFVQSNRNS